MSAHSEIMAILLEVLHTPEDVRLDLAVEDILEIARREGI